MATKRTRSARSQSGKKTSKKKSSSQRPPMLKEPPAARVMQAMILVLAMLLLFGAIVTPRASAIIVGLLVLATAFPPIRGPVDQWLTGKRRGKDAEQAAAVRMALGLAVVLFSLLRVFSSG